MKNRIRCMAAWGGIALASGLAFDAKFYGTSFALICVAVVLLFAAPLLTEE